MELPCIAYGERGVKEIIENGRNGVLVDRGDPSLLAAGLRRLLEDPEWRKSLGTEARRSVQERFSWKVHLEGVMEAYRRLTERPPRTKM